MLRKVISGGQTGVDRAALRATFDLDLPTGGWCPPGFDAEDGFVPETFNLKPTPKNHSSLAPGIPRSQRTEWNVKDSDGTLIIVPDFCNIDMGTQFTINVAWEMEKPHWICSIQTLPETNTLYTWLKKSKIETLNIAGPSEKTSPGIEDIIYKWWYKTLKKIKLHDRV